LVPKLAKVSAWAVAKHISYEHDGDSVDDAITATFDLHLSTGISGVL
jgi:hypothetical protein